MGPTRFSTAGTNRSPCSMERMNMVTKNCENSRRTSCGAMPSMKMPRKEVTEPEKTEEPISVTARAVARYRMRRRSLVASAAPPPPRAWCCRTNSRTLSRYAWQMWLRASSPSPMAMRNSVVVAVDRPMLSIRMASSMSRSMSRMDPMTSATSSHDEMNRPIIAAHATHTSASCTNVCGSRPMYFSQKRNLVEKTKVPGSGDRAAISRSSTTVSAFCRSFAWLGSSGAVTRDVLICPNCRTTLAWWCEPLGCAKNSKSHR
mmetsp:Transcript_4016/g.13079  ORF Transcript_4016/g.13079 Transcript_4016/m.13079 type:complete len:260 (-) Transcript_4016:312-1091(-)